MPAVNLLNLRKEITSLLWEFTDPESFRDKLAQLLDHYRIMSFRSGSVALTSYQTPELHVPHLVLHELELALYQTIREQPQAALTLCDSLWDDVNLEMHTVATRILGQIPIEYIDQVLIRINEWTQKGLKHSELKVFFRNAAGLIRQKQPEKLMRSAQDWCAEPDNKNRERGIRLMIYLVEDPAFINLPAVYTALEKMLPDADAVLQPDLTELIGLLLNRSEIETSFFIRQMLENPDSGKIIRRIARKLLPKIPEPSRESIQNLLRTSQKEN